MRLNQTRITHWRALDGLVDQPIAAIRIRCHRLQRHHTEPQWPLRRERPTASDAGGGSGYWLTLTIKVGAIGCPSRLRESNFAWSRDLVRCIEEARE
jgi:hypothetical protein